jgi:hypothetical protein
MTQAVRKATEMSAGIAVNVAEIEEWPVHMDHLCRNMIAKN